MTIREVNEIFRTKYPEGEVWQRESSRVSVKFNRRSKVYDYLYQSYAELLNRLGFNVQYKRDREGIVSRINQLKQELKDGYTESWFLGKEYLTDKEKEWRKKRIKGLEEIIETAIWVNG